MPTFVDDMNDQVLASLGEVREVQLPSTWQNNVVENPFSTMQDLVPVGDTGSISAEENILVVGRTFRPQGRRGRIEDNLFACRVLQAHGQVAAVVWMFQYLLEFLPHNEINGSTKAAKEVLVRNLLHTTSNLSLFILILTLVGCSYVYGLRTRRVIGD